MNILILLLLFATPSMAESNLEMFEEICEVTGEIRTGYRLREINISRLQTSTPTFSQPPSVKRDTF